MLSGWQSNPSIGKANLLLFIKNYQCTSLLECTTLFMDRIGSFVVNMLFLLCNTLSFSTSAACLLLLLCSGPNPQHVAYMFDLIE